MVQSLSEGEEMRKARLIKIFTECDNQGDRILCEFHKTIQVDDVPPIGYTVTFPESNRIAKFFVERADIQSTSGNVTLYDTIEIQRYENWDYEQSVYTMLSMRRLGWEIKKPHEVIKEKWKEAQEKFKVKGTS
jgi:hypothetical protein